MLYNSITLQVAPLRVLITGSPEFDNGAGDRLEEWDEFLKECETCDPFDM